MAHFTFHLNPQLATKRVEVKHATGKGYALLDLSAWSAPPPGDLLMCGNYLFGCSLYCKTAADLDSLIEHATALRRELAEAEEVALTEAAARQMKCDDCDHTGTDANPLVPVESTAAHPEGMVHAEGCPEVPHAEDAHADHAPVG